MLAAKLITVQIFIGWTVVLVAPLFLVMKAAGILRISRAEEIIRKDVYKYGSMAYLINAPVAAEQGAVDEIDHLGIGSSIESGV